MSPQIVLILSRQPTIGALLGIYVELCGHRPLFAAAGQDDTEAIGQSDPAVILVDLEPHDGARTAFLRRQVAIGRSVVLLGSERGDVASLAAQLSVPFVSMPVEAASFRVVLEQAIRAAAANRRPTA